MHLDLYRSNSLCSISEDLTLFPETLWHPDFLHKQNYVRRQGNEKLASVQSLVCVRLHGRSLISLDSYVFTKALKEGTMAFVVTQAPSSENLGSVRSRARGQACPTRLCLLHFTKASSSQCSPCAGTCGTGLSADFRP